MLFREVYDKGPGMTQWLACHSCNPWVPGLIPGADPGFLERGFKFTKGGLFC